MEQLDMNWYLIIATFVIILSYVFNFISRKTNFPSVILLLMTGFGIEQLRVALGVGLFNIMPLLEVLGTLGLIMIVLEAALDLKISKEKWPVIWRSFLIALILLLVTSFSVATIIYFALELPLFTSLIYAVPLSIMSSAIIIPSITHLKESTREFMIYEATFSDILGILFFYFLIQEYSQVSVPNITFQVIANVVLTVIVSLLITYLIVYLFKNIRTGVRFIVVFASLILIYSLGKILHMSSLLMILIFGLIVNNRKVFFQGMLNRLIKRKKAYDEILVDFKNFTAESAFLIRTYFFVIFGMTFSLQYIQKPEVLIITALVLVALYVVRYINLKGLLHTKRVLPELFLAPRGLVTIILFYDIPKNLLVGHFEEGIIFMTIISTSIIMMIALILSRSHIDEFKRKVVSHN